MKIFALLLIVTFFVATFQTVKGDEVSLEMAKELKDKSIDLVHQIKEKVKEKIANNGKFDWAESMKRMAFTLRNMIRPLERLITKLEKGEKVSSGLLKNEYDKLKRNYDRDYKTYEDVFLKNKEMIKRSSSFNRSLNRSLSRNG